MRVCVYLHVSVNAHAHAWNAQRTVPHGARQARAHGPGLRRRRRSAGPASQAPPLLPRRSAVVFLPGAGRPAPTWGRARSPGQEGAGQEHGTPACGSSVIPAFSHVPPCALCGEPEPTLSSGPVSVQAEPARPTGSPAVDGSGVPGELGPQVRPLVPLTPPKRLLRVGPILRAATGSPDSRPSWQLLLVSCGLPCRVPTCQPQNHGNPFLKSTSSPPSPTSAASNARKLFGWPLLHSEGTGQTGLAQHLEEAAGSREFLSLPFRFPWFGPL